MKIQVKRDYYLDQLIRKKDNGLIKVITGIRRCGKSYLLFELYHSYLNSVGIADRNIIEISLDDEANARYRNPMELNDYIQKRVSGKKEQYYVFLDEIQHVQAIQNPWLKNTEDRIGFVDVLLGLMKIKNIDIYVTGSNSVMLSSDIVTQFRDRGDEIHMYPLSYAEYCSAYPGSREKAWQEYITYGGLPRILSLDTAKEKADYLRSLLNSTYRKDVLERNDIRNDEDVLDDLLHITASSIGSLTSPAKLADTFRSVKKRSVNSQTISKYLKYFEDAFLLDRAERYDIKGKRYIDTLIKYYFTDIGLRNACMNFRQPEENHIMENIIFNELKMREYSVDVGIVEYRHRNAESRMIRSMLEVDFVAHAGSQTYYIQSALHADETEKRLQETNSLNRIPDSFRKILIVKDQVIPWNDEKGILTMGVQDFLLNKDSLNQ